MGKIFYSAECDETWGENEIDYCFFIKKPFTEKDFNINPDEIENYRWVGKDEILSFLADRYKAKEGVTPWFGAIMHYDFFKWWDALIQNKLHTFTPKQGVVNLNPFQKPIFKEHAGTISNNLSI